MKALLPSDLTVREVFRGRFGDDDQVKGEILNGFGRGPLLVNYIGHGSVGIWRGDIFNPTMPTISRNGLSSALRHRHDLPERVLP